MHSAFLRFPAIVTLLVGIAPARANDPIDFGRDVRQILSDNCFLCHGPDEATRQADLRLDVRAEAIEYGAIAPGQLNDSQLWARITSDDPDLVMPPPNSGKQLTGQEQQTLRRWIEQGAKYSQHWAFAPPVRPKLPEVSDPTWVRNPIDRFVLKKLEQHGLEPSPQADPITLVRRLYLDLVGLPPSPAEIDRHLPDQKSSAYAQLTEELLASEHFGERWARLWLDAARYSDSDGYEKDKQRSVWFYRDWVINAMNQDMPYRDFIVQQIAGDLLPDAGQSERVATGFLRNSMVNEEGGADPEQFRVEGMFDRMDAIGKAILGITTQCAQCHTHKYDPLSQREYYQMFAALNDFHEAIITVFTPEQARQRDVVLSRIAEIEQGIKQRIPDWSEQLDQWEDLQRARLVKWRTVTPTDLPFEGQKFRVLEDGSIISESYAPTRATNTFRLTTTADKITAFRLDVLTHPQLPRGGPGRSIYGTGALTEFEVSITPAGTSGQSQKIDFSRAIADVNPPRAQLPAAFRDRDPTKDQRVTGPVAYAIDGENKTAWSTDIGPGRRNQSRHAIFVPEQPLTNSGEIVLAFTLKQNHGGWNSDDNQNYLLGRYRFSVTDGDIGEATLPSNVESILQTPHAQRSSEQQAQLFSYWRTTQDALASENAEIEQAWQAFPDSDSQLVVEATRRPRETYVLTRGNFLDHGEPVKAAAPGFLGTLPTSDEPDRLRLARWLVRRDAPTTARVIVNRIWQSYFGRGIVTTPEDFGFQSSPPTHPQLLDWLAVELMDNNWSLKHIHRLIVSSATYRQTSVVNDQLAQADPLNQWLARGPRLRVDAELVRDIALRVSGLLNDRLGGPSVYPPAPDFLFQPPASYGPKIWNTSTDSQQYRRSLYVHSYRSVPYPAMQVFDAPKGDAACIRRQRSNTPLQALVLLNEPQFVECARAMATRILRSAEEDDDETRLRFAHRLAVGRPPEPAELSILKELLVQQRERIKNDSVDVQELLGVSPALVRQLTGTEAQEVVPWMIVARALLNLDETITKQ